MNVGEAFKRLGYHFAYRHVDARRYLLPHRRTRVWMWAVRDDISAVPAASRVTALLEQLEQPEPAPLDPFLEVAAGGELPRQELNAREGKVLMVEALARLDRRAWSLTLPSAKADACGASVRSLVSCPKTASSG